MNAIRLLTYVLLAGLLVFGGCRWQANNDKAEIQAQTARADKAEDAIKALARLTREAATKAKDASVTVKRASEAADKSLKEKTNEANRNAAELARALRAGKQRLSDVWACPVPAGQSGGVAADAGQAAAERRADSAARIVAAADADAAVIDWLWDRWKADRRAVIQAGCAVESAE